VEIDEIARGTGRYIPASGARFDIDCIRVVKWDMMNERLPATRKVLSEVFANLGAGWFGFILITPAAIPSVSFSDLVFNIARSFIYGSACIVVAIDLSKEVTS
jgi:hypothetical protein